MEQGHYCVSVTATTPPPAPLTSIQQSHGNGGTVVLQTTTGELLATVCKGVVYSIPYQKGCQIS